MYVPQKIKLFTLCPSYTALLNLTVHAHCTGPLELVPKFIIFLRSQVSASYSIANASLQELESEKST